MKLIKMPFKKTFFKIQFNPPSKKKILIYDAVGLEYFDKFFFKKIMKYFIIDMKKLIFLY